MIAAVCNNMGIGKDGKMPWYIPEDLKYFQNVTDNSVIVMGHNTWLSIPPNKRPLKNRFNVVVCSKKDMYVPTDNAVFVNIDELDTLLKRYDKAYIIGGSRLYERFMVRSDMLYLTRIDKDYECDVFFPPINHLYQLESVSEQYYSKDGIPYRFEVYKNTLQN